MSILHDVKIALRLKSDHFDDAELEPIIAAATADLERVGIIFSETDPLCERAVILYAKANFGFADDQDKFNKAYTALRDAMSLSEAYITPKAGDDP